MSGGTFNHSQYQLQYIADEIQETVRNNTVKDEYGYCNDFSEETLEEFRIAIKKLREAHVYAQRIDWLLAGDDGEETFHKRLKEDLDEL